MVARPQPGGEAVTPQELRLDILPTATRKAFLACANAPWLAENGWYLAGGTALALQVGHRVSVDLDFFTTAKDFDKGRIETFFAQQGAWATTLSQEGTLYGLFQDAKMSFIAYPFFRPSKKVLRRGTTSILFPEDIAAMKIVAISQRGKKRDFIDLYWLSQNGFPLEEALVRAVRQYPEQEHSLPHFLKSLVYFADAEDDTMPQIFFDTDWKKVKKYFQDVTPPLARKIFQ